MSHTELSQRWLTACGTRSLTALMRPLFHTNSWFVLLLTHTSALPSSYMDDLQICMKVQYDAQGGDLFSLHHLWMTEPQTCQLWGSIISICLLWDSHMSSPLVEHLQQTLCHLPVILTHATLLGRCQNCYWLLDSGLNALLNVFFSNGKLLPRAAKSK